MCQCFWPVGYTGKYPGLQKTYMNVYLGWWGVRRPLLRKSFFIILHMIKIFQNKILFEKGFISLLFFLFLNEEVGSFSTKLVRWETSSSPVGSQWFENKMLTMKSSVSGWEQTLQSKGDSWWVPCTGHLYARYCKCHWLRDFCRASYIIWSCEDRKHHIVLTNQLWGKTCDRQTPILKP